MLSQPLTVSYTAVDTPVPPASDTAVVDGYTLKLSGSAVAGKRQTMTVAVTKNGEPVTNLERYLKAFAHLTAFKADNLEFLHLHPMDTGTAANGGPTLKFSAEFPAKGSYRVFMQFQTGGQVHTVAFTVNAS